jgi:hypothetical protein
MVASEYEEAPSARVRLCTLAFFAVAEPVLFGQLQMSCTTHLKLMAPLRDNVQGLPNMLL